MPARNGLGRPPSSPPTLAPDDALHPNNSPPPLDLRMLLASAITEQERAAESEVPALGDAATAPARRAPAPHAATAPIPPLPFGLRLVETLILRLSAMLFPALALAGGFLLWRSIEGTPSPLQLGWLGGYGVFAVLLSLIAGARTRY